MPITCVRTMTPGVGVDSRTRSYCLDATESVVVAYATDKCKGVRTGMPDFEAAQDEARALVREGSRKGVMHIILPDSRAWFGFPEAM